MKATSCILVTHTGPGFLNPERAFDPYVPAQAGGETAGLGLSLCATILRDNNGRASAVNLEPSRGSDHPGTAGGLGLQRLFPFLGDHMILNEFMNWSRCAAVWSFVWSQSIGRSGSRQETREHCN